MFHEYGHGISNRLIGNGSTALSGIQSGAMGEGWSDYWPSQSTTMVPLASTSPIIQTAFGEPLILFLPQPCTTLTPTSKSSSVHNDGEVWAATLWDQRTQLGAATTDRLVLNGMKFTPNRPSFLNARDGILQADQNLFGGANRCAIWTVFARHGMGVSAVGNDGTTHIAATDLPADCGGTCSFSINPTSASFVAAGGSGSVTVTTQAGCNWTAVSNNSFITIISGCSGSGSGTLNYSVAANTSTLSRNGSLTIASLTHSVSQAGTGGGCSNAIVNPGFETGTTPWTASGQVTRSTGAFPHSGTAYMILNGVNSSTGTLFQNGNCSD